MVEVALRGCRGRPRAGLAVTRCRPWSAEADPSLAARQPYLAAVTGDLAWLGAAVDKHYAGDDSDLGMLIHAVSESSAGASVEEYEASVAAFAVARPARTP